MVQPCNDLLSTFFKSVLVFMEFHRRLLILAYSTGLQIWDCTNLDSITEMLNVSGPEWGRVLHAEVLPNPSAAAGDEFIKSRPLLGMMCGSGISFASCTNMFCSAKHQDQGPDFLAYSLSAHKVVKKLSIPGIVSFLANPNVIVIVRACLLLALTLSVPFLRARPAQLHSVSFHLALSCPYPSFLLVFLHLHNPIHSQRTQIPIPPHLHRRILIQIASLLVPTPYLPCPTVFLLMLVGSATL